MLIDSHCHLDRIDLKPFAGDINALINEASVHRVEHMLCVSINLEAYGNMLSLVGNNPSVSISVGVHPNESECEEPSIERLVELAQNQKVVAIGETGLDYFRSRGDLAWQHERFRVHIRSAGLVGKPLIIHTRDAAEDTLRILVEEGAQNIGGVFHCFAESWDIAKAVLDLGFYISFSGIVTFNNAAQVKEVAKRIPADRYLIETDSPYLAPVPHRGRPNYPYYVSHVADAIADIRGETFDQIEKESSDNYRRLFHKNH